MIIYFSGTGNSRFAAELLGKTLGDSVIDGGKIIKNGAQGVFQSQTPWVFAAPVYSWRMPRIFSDFIEKARFSGSRDAYFVLTCGSEIGEAGKYARKLCQRKGLTYRGTLQVPMPENLITLFKAPPEPRIREMLQEAVPILEQGAGLIRQGKPLSENKCGLLDRIKSGPVNEGFTRFFLRSSDFYATDACVACGKCAENCPLNNIRLVEGKPQWGQSCTQCMACICRCPVEAIEYGKKTQGKARYVCPEI